MSRFQTHGRLGKSQNGVDILGRISRKAIGIQCKGRDEALGSKLTKRDVDDAVCKADTFPGELAEFYIFTTAPDDPDIQSYALMLSKTREAKGQFPVQVCGWGTIEQMIALCPRVRASFYAERDSANHSRSIVMSVALVLCVVVGMYLWNQHIGLKDRQDQQSVEQLRRFIKSIDGLSDLYSNCLNKLESEPFLFSAAIKDSCTVPIGDHLAVLDKQYDDLAPSLAGRPLTDIANLLPLMQEDWRQMLIAKDVTEAYEDEVMRAWNNECVHLRDRLHPLHDDLVAAMPAAKNALNQQLQAYFVMRDFGVPDLRSIKARASVFARELQSETIPPQLSEQANEIGTLLAARREYSFQPTSSPLSLAVVKKLSSRDIKASGLPSEIEQARWDDVSHAALFSALRGRPKEIEHLIDCKILKPEARKLAIAPL